MSKMNSYNKCVNDGMLDMKSLNELTDEELASGNARLDPTLDDSSPRFWDDRFRLVYAEYAMIERGE